ncbi:MAG: hypothetical protein NTX24_00810 [Candidatus Pacearchaeota archaeon]|nr:hypothetical protein [Candidatus Pacearchaeota archaeon]
MKRGNGLYLVLIALFLITILFVNGCGTTNPGDNQSNETKGTQLSGGQENNENKILMPQPMELCGNFKLAEITLSGFIVQTNNPTKCNLCSTSGCKLCKETQIYSQAYNPQVHGESMDEGLCCYADDGKKILLTSWQENENLPADVITCRTNLLLKKDKCYGYKIDLDKTIRGGITATKVDEEVLGAGCELHSECAITHNFGDLSYEMINKNKYTQEYPSILSLEINFFKNNWSVSVQPYFEDRSICPDEERAKYSPESLIEELKIVTKEIDQAIQ